MSQQTGNQQPSNPHFQDEILRQVARLQAESLYHAFKAKSSEDEANALLRLVSTPQKAVGVQTEVSAKAEPATPRTTIDDLLDQWRAQPNLTTATQGNIATIASRLKRWSDLPLRDREGTFWLVLSEWQDASRNAFSPKHMLGLLHCVWAMLPPVGDVRDFCAANSIEWQPSHELTLSVLTNRGWGMDKTKEVEHCCRILERCVRATRAGWVVP